MAQVGKTLADLLAVAAGLLAGAISPVNASLTVFRVPLMW
jgi:hypothetical protein